ncbi:sulfatase-like hydrolase/transferase [Niameybacter sp.]|uniref:sulfatase-like hydrolase/transferase n=1 Tax=Niameybacter sp. TaxID=2033640 RepID=UPI002FC62859
MKKKNILLIFTDQHRVDTLSCYNPNAICKTPNIDALTRESVVFNNAYTTCPVCSPARSSLHAGVYPAKTGMETNLYQTGCRTHELQDTPNLLSRRLQTVGYELGYTGKWHLGVGANKQSNEEGRNIVALQEKGFMDSAAYTNYGTLPTDIGFIGDDFPGHGNGGWGYPQFKQYLKDQNLNLEMINHSTRVRPGDHSVWAEVISPLESTIEYYITQRAIDIMDELKEKENPFFFALNFWGPHEPFFAPTQFLDMYRDVDIPENPSFKEDIKNMPKIYNLLRRPEVDWSFFQNTLRHYYACMSHIDAQIGRLMDYLKANNLYEDTVIIFAADHGDNQGCHGGLENKSYSMYDDTTKIPLFIRPASGYAGYTQEAFASTCDIYATILDLAGYVPTNVFGFGDGQPLTRFIESADQEGWVKDIVTQGMGAFDVVTTQRMYRQGHYKYVFNGAGEDQFFNLLDDPNEMNNLIESEQHQDTLLQIKNDFADWMTKHGDIARHAFCKINRIKEWKI